MTFDLTRRQFGIGAGALGAAGLLPIGGARAATNLKYGNAGNIDTLSNRFNSKLAEVLEQRSDGELTMEIFAGTLGGEETLIQGMSLGTIDIYNGAYTGTREFDILYSPFMFKDGEHAGRVVKGEIGDQASQVLQDKYDARLLGAGRLGPYVLFVKDPIESIGDIAGRKIRTPQIEGCIAAVEHLGGNATPVPFNEVYLALQQGIVDGLITALNVAVAVKFYEVCEYVVSNEFGQALDKQLISNRAWNNLSADHQTLLQETFNELEEVDYFQAGVNAIPTDLATWEEMNGEGTVLTLDSEEIAEQMAPLNERLVNEVYGDGAWETMQNA
jgi:TRAP-type C4-dicarboxylate transport system substrate-binding protein